MDFKLVSVGSLLSSLICKPLCQTSRALEPTSAGSHAKKSWSIGTIYYYIRVCPKMEDTHNVMAYPHVPYPNGFHKHVQTHPYHFVVENSPMPGSSNRSSRQNISPSNRYPSSTCGANALRGFLGRTLGPPRAHCGMVRMGPVVKSPRGFGGTLSSSCTNGVMFFL